MTRLCIPAPFSSYPLCIFYFSCGLVSYRVGVYSVDDIGARSPFPSCTYITLTLRTFIRTVSFFWHLFSAPLVVVLSFFCTSCCRS